MAAALGPGERRHPGVDLPGPPGPAGCRARRALPGQRGGSRPAAGAARHGRGRAPAGGSSPGTRRHVPAGPHLAWRPGGGAPAEKRPPGQPALPRLPSRDPPRHAARARPQAAEPPGACPEARTPAAVQARRRDGPQAHRAADRSRILRRPHGAGTCPHHQRPAPSADEARGLRRSPGLPRNRCGHDPGPPRGHHAATHHHGGRSRPAPRKKGPS
jgi:hypothetical protein